MSTRFGEADVLLSDTNSVPLHESRLSLPSWQNMFVPGGRGTVPLLHCSTTGVPQGKEHDMSI